jgi:hypothetical protein
LHVSVCSTPGLECYFFVILIFNFNKCYIEFEDPAFVSALSPEIWKLVKTGFVPFSVFPYYGKELEQVLQLKKTSKKQDWIGHVGLIYLETGKWLVRFFRVVKFLDSIKN